MKNVSSEMNSVYSLSDKQSMICVQASLLYEALTARLETIYDRLVDQIEPGGVREFENHFHNWIPVFLFFSDQTQRYFSPIVKPEQSLSLQDLNFDEGKTCISNLDLINELGMDEMTVDIIPLVQDILNVVADEIGKTQLIPRTQRHLQRGLLRLKTEIVDYGDVLHTITFPLIQTSSIESDVDARSGFLQDQDADEKDWVIEWMRESLSETGILALESILDGISRNN